jgi:hypothetical protein
MGQTTRSSHNTDSLVCRPDTQPLASHTVPELPRLLPLPLWRRRQVLPPRLAERQWILVPTIILAHLFQRLCFVRCNWDE